MRQNWPSCDFAAITGVCFKGIPPLPLYQLISRRVVVDRRTIKTFLKHSLSQEYDSGT